MTLPVCGAMKRYTKTCRSRPVHSGHIVAQSELIRVRRPSWTVNPSVQCPCPDGNGSVTRSIHPTDEPATSCFQLALAEGAKELEDRHEASPAVAAAVKKGSFAEVCCLYSFSARDDWITSAITSANDSSHGTAAKISFPAIA
jgi:hypothetical protein